MGNFENPRRRNEKIERVKRTYCAGEERRREDKFSLISLSRPGMGWTTCTVDMHSVIILRLILYKGLTYMA